MFVLASTDELIPEGNAESATAPVLSRNEYSIDVSFVPSGCSVVTVSALKSAVALSPPANGIVMDELFVLNATMSLEVVRVIVFVAVFPPRVALTTTDPEAPFDTFNVAVCVPLTSSTPSYSSSSDHSTAPVSFIPSAVCQLALSETSFAGSPASELTQPLYRHR